MSAGHLDAARWPHVKALLTELFGLPPAERRLRLDLCEDPELRSEVEALLEADRQADELLADTGATPFEGSGEDLDWGPGLPAGARVGPYRILDELGRGGMGVVYRAERADGHFQQLVAIKLVKRGMDSDLVLRHFAAERQILARLQHPNIACLLDGGMSAGGRPYLVMELVQGSPLFAFCERRGLDVSARVRLMQQVCAAVQHAHRNLVVHRDLKPANVLVTDDEHVRLLDFGIAKLLDDDQGLAAPTGLGQRLMTPEYAAPEQLRGEAVTTATDVYALGLLLRELVTGQRRPPGRAPRLGRGDLDSIVDLALRDEPERRYASVEALNADLQRFLTGLPVRARRGTLRYRAQKFLGRNRTAVAFAALGLCSLVFGSSLALWQARAALKQADEARVTKDFLVSVFHASDPNAGDGDKITARELLDRGAQRIERELGGQPDLAAELSGIVGSLYLDLHLANQALPLLEREVALRRRAEAPIPLADALVRLAHAHDERGEVQPAEKHLHEALDISRRARGDDHPDTVAVASELSLAWLAQGKRAQAHHLALENLERLRRQHATTGATYAASIEAFGLILHEEGDFVGASSAIQEALERYRALYGSRHFKVAEQVQNLAAMMVELDRPERAEALLREARDMLVALHGPNHPDLVYNLNSLAAVLLMRERWSEAEQVSREALALVRGREQPSAAVLHFTLAQGLQGQGRLLEGLQELHIAARLNTLGARGQSLEQALTLSRTGDVLRDLGRLPESERSLRQGLEMFAALGLTGHPKHAMALAWLGSTLMAEGRAGAAEPVLQAALREHIAARGEESWPVASARLALARCFVALDRRNEAQTLVKQALPGIARAKGEDNKLTHEARRLLASLA